MFVRADVTVCHSKVTIAKCLEVPEENTSISMRGRAEINVNEETFSFSKLLICLEQEKIYLRP